MTDIQENESRPDVASGELPIGLRALIDAGVDAIHCSQRRILEPEFPDVDGPHGLNFAGWVKKLTGIPTIAVGSVGLSSEFTGAFRGEALTSR